MGISSLLGQRPRPPVADADLEAVGADVVEPGEAVLAVAASEHRVAGDALAEPSVVRGVTDADDPAGPFVAEADREVRVALIDVGHLAGVELDVGAADADPLDLDEQFTGGGDRVGHVEHRRLARCGDDERAHQRDAVGSGMTCWVCVPSRVMLSVMVSPPWRYSGGVMPRPTPGGVPVLIRSPGSSARNWLR